MTVTYIQMICNQTSNSITLSLTSLKNTLQNKHKHKHKQKSSIQLNANMIERVCSDVNELENLFVCHIRISGAFLPGPVQVLRDAVLFLQVIFIL